SLSKVSDTRAGGAAASEGVAPTAIPAVATGTAKPAASPAHRCHREHRRRACAPAPDLMRVMNLCPPSAPGPQKLTITGPALAACAGRTPSGSTAACQHTLAGGELGRHPPPVVFSLRRAAVRGCSSLLRADP